MNQSKYLLVCFLFILVSSKKIFSQNNLSYISSTTGAACYEVEYYNNHLFVGAGNTLMVYDLDVNLKPQTKHFEYRFKSNITDIKVSGTKMFIAANHAGISVWDVQNINNTHVPVFIDEYVPTQLTEAAYDIALKGNDSIFVAFKGKMALFTFNGVNIALVNFFAAQPNGTFVMGCDVKNNLLAFVTSSFDTVVTTNTTTGTHIYNCSPNQLTQLSFIKQDTCDPHDVLFGQNNNLLHVLGGTESWVSPTQPYGFYYAYNVSNPSIPQLVFKDSLPNFIYTNIAQPMNGQLRNDTLFVACLGAWDPLHSMPLTGNVYVYKAVSNNSVQRLTNLYAGLWHFDLTLNANRMYVASEWYGIKTIDITNIYNEQDLGNTLTGGWNITSDKFGSKMIVGNEGYGFKMFDVQNIYNPIYLSSNYATGFCFGVSFSPAGNYIYGWYYTEDDFRVFDANTLQLIGSLPLSGLLTDYSETFAYLNKAIALQKTSGYEIKIVDVTSPSSPVLQTSINLGVGYRDIFVSKTGYLYVAKPFFLEVYNLNQPTNALVTSIIAPGGQFSKITEYKDTVYAYIENGNSSGIRKYYFNGNTLAIQGSNNVALPIAGPKMLAVDSFGLYVNYQENGLYSFNKNTISQTGFYRHGQEYYRPTQWGQQQLFCKDNLIFVVEYMAQTTILSGNPAIVSANNSDDFSDNTIFIFPNPISSGDDLTIEYTVMPNLQIAFYLFDVVGNNINVNWFVQDEKIIVKTNELASGIYCADLILNNKHYTSKLAVVTRK